MSKQVMWSILSIVMGGVLGLPAWADTPTFRQVSQVSPPAPLSVATVDRQAPGAPLVFTVAPRETTAEAQKVYAPIADYLTKSTGQKFAFQYTESWLEYQDRMRKGEYDLILDGPHFVGWRASTMGHVVLLKLPQKQVWVVVARKDNDRIKSMTNIAEFWNAHPAFLIYQPGAPTGLSDDPWLERGI
jgi:ABC-type phosphate/phosphonate transport system substrate-binding protein